MVLICLFWSVLFDIAWNIRAIYFVLVNADASLLYTAPKVDEEVSIYYSRCTISLVQVIAIARVCYKLLQGVLLPQLARIMLQLTLSLFRTLMKYKVTGLHFNLYFLAITCTCDKTKLLLY